MSIDFKLMKQLRRSRKKKNIYIFSQCSNVPECSWIYLVSTV